MKYTKKLNTLGVGELVTYKDKRGVVVYSALVTNKNGVRLTVWWEGENVWKFVKHLNCRRMEDPTVEDIKFAESHLDCMRNANPPDTRSNLFYLEIVSNLKPYKDKVKKI
jgi:hypothetical protein